MAQIDLIGLRGSGKTTLANEILSEFSNIDSHKNAVKKSVLKNVINTSKNQYCHTIPFSLFQILARVSGLEAHSINYFGTKFPDSYSLVFELTDKYSKNESHVNMISRTIISKSSERSIITSKNQYCHRIPFSFFQILARVSGLEAHSINYFETKFPDVHSLVFELTDKYSKHESHVNMISRTIITKSSEKSIINYYSGDLNLTTIPTTSYDSLTQLSRAIFCPPSPSQSISKEDVKQYVMAIPFPDELIYVNPSIDTCIKRKSEVHEDFLQKYKCYGPDPIKRFMSRNDYLNSLLIKYMRERTNIIEIKNEGDIYESLSKIKQNSEYMSK